jgi:hypothetical protein
VNRVCSHWLLVQLRPLALLIFATMVISASMNGGSLRAAEIECAQTISLGSSPIPEEVLRKRWPSGFRPTAGMCWVGYLHGVIARGDFEKVSDFYKKNHRVLTTVYLWSSGGEVDDAVKIGKLFRKYLISLEAPTTWRHIRGVPLIPPTLGAPPQWDAQGSLLDTRWFCRGSDCVCASACALIWFGGADRRGEVGLHRPRITDPQFKSLSPVQATAAYRRTLEDIEGYLREMEVPRPIIDTMVATGSSEVQWVDAEKDHLQRPPSLAEWEDSNCQEVTAKEENTVINLRLKEEQALLSSNDALLLKLLEDRSLKYISCKNDFRRVQVDKLSPP